MTPKWGNIFVLCTGRCGSTTFTKAAEQIKNFTAGHETRTHLTGEDRFAYPRNHIEVDNRLSWLLGRLDKHFGATAFYVHLKRNPEQVAESFVKRSDRGIMLAYRTEILMRAGKLSRDTSMEDFAHDYIQTVNSNIDLFLKDKHSKMQFNLENWECDFPKFWKAIGAEGCLQAAQKEFNIRHNASES